MKKRATLHASLTLFSVCSSAQSSESEEEIAEIRAWLFDRDIIRDATSGKLDALAAEAPREDRDGQR